MNYRTMDILIHYNYITTTSICETTQYSSIMMMTSLISSFIMNLTFVSMFQASKVGSSCIYTNLSHDQSGKGVESSGTWCEAINRKVLYVYGLKKAGHNGEISCTNGTLVKIRS